MEADSRSIDPAIKQEAPTGPASGLQFPLKMHGREWIANIKACRNGGMSGINIVTPSACEHREPSRDICLANNEACVANALNGTCPTGRQPFSKGVVVASITYSPSTIPATFGSNIGRTRHGLTPPAEPVNFPIDLVYTWVNNADPAWQAKYDQYVKNASLESTRFFSADELKYSLRSVERFAPWINTIWIITDRQRPSWLDTANSKLRIVDHTDFIEPECLPTFNSNTIESRIGRIDGLAEHFIYANDDTMFGAPVEPGHFFTAAGLAQVRMEGNLRGTGNGSFTRMNANAAQLLDGAFGPKAWKKGWHQVSPLRRSAWAEWDRLFGEALRQQGKYRLRGVDDIAWNAGLWPPAMIELGLGIPGSPIEECYISAQDRNADQIMADAIERMPHLFCINNSTAEKATRVKQWLEAYFPNASAFERDLPGDSGMRLEDRDS